MSALTPNALTPEQDLLVRDFYQKIVAEEGLWPQNAKTRQMVGSALLQLLGYAVSAGNIVPIGTTVTFKYGQKPDTGEFAGLFDRDRAIVEGMLDDTPKVTVNITRTDEASSSESPEGDEVGDVLLEDV